MAVDAERGPEVVAVEQCLAEAGEYAGAVCATGQLDAFWHATTEWIGQRRRYHCHARRDNRLSRW